MWKCTFLCFRSKDDPTNCSSEDSCKENPISVRQLHSSASQSYTITTASFLKKMCSHISPSLASYSKRSWIMRPHHIPESEVSSCAQTGAPSKTQKLYWTPRKCSEVNYNTLKLCISYIHTQCVIGVFKSPSL